jgi:predicted  nucleic acid-binding Zn-ribbon protein
MNGKQIFCLSLIILSVAMGFHWFKHRPKVKKKPTNRPRVALNLDDLQVQDQNENNDEEQDVPEEDLPEEEKTEPADEPEDDPIENNETASESVEIVENASETIELPPELDDPIIISLRSMPRNPFEQSPYAKLVEQIRAAEAAAQEEEGIPQEEKKVSLLQANFTGTIKTPKELVAVIDSRLYRKGDEFQNRKITSIQSSLVALDTGSDLFLIPKVGVSVNIATDGTYTYEDSFHKN